MFPTKTLPGIGNKQNQTAFQVSLPFALNNVTEAPQQLVQAGLRVCGIGKKGNGNNSLKAHSSFS